MTVQEGKSVVVAVRMPHDLAEWLRLHAAEDHRSISAQAAWVLSQFRKQQPPEVAA